MKKINLSALLCSVVFFGSLAGCSLLGGSTGSGGIGSNSQNTKYYEITETNIEDFDYVLKHAEYKTLYINKMYM